MVQLETEGAQPRARGERGEHLRGRVDVVEVRGEVHVQRLEQREGGAREDLGERLRAGDVDAHGELAHEAHAPAEPRSFGYRADHLAGVLADQLFFTETQRALRRRRLHRRLPRVLQRDQLALDVALREEPVGMNEEAFWGVDGLHVCDDT